jgi:hypothetical protein
MDLMVETDYWAVVNGGSQDPVAQIKELLDSRGWEAMGSIVYIA